MIFLTMTVFFFLYFSPLFSFLFFCLLSFRFSLMIFFSQDFHSYPYIRPINSTDLRILLFFLLICILSA